jgi:hypothetical protein
MGDDMAEVEEEETTLIVTVNDRQVFNKSHTSDEC